MQSFKKSVVLFGMLLLTACGSNVSQPSSSSSSSSPTHFQDMPIDQLPSMLTYDLDGQVYEAKFELLAREILTERAKDHDGFHQILRFVYGDYNIDVAEEYRLRMAEGDYSWQPDVKIVKADVLGETFGAYAASKGLVYLDEEAPGTPARALVLLEELGHHLDTLIRTEDTPGDEGGLFRRTVLGEEMTPDEEAQLRALNDHATIIVDGETIDVEQWFGSKAWKKIKSVVKAVVSVPQSAASMVSDAARGVYNATPLGGWLTTGLSTAVGQIADLAQRNALGTVRDLYAVKNTLIGMGYGMGDGMRELGTGIEKIARGDIASGITNVVGGMAKMAVETPADVALTITLESITDIQTRLGLEPIGRGLNGEERNELWTVFRGSVDYNQIILKEGFCGIYSVNDRAFTSQNTIYLKKRGIGVPKEDRNSTIVHETVHVWQHQHGGAAYKLYSIYDQLKFGGNAYDWRNAFYRGYRWNPLNLEHQAQLVEEAYYDGFFKAPERGWISRIDFKNYTSYIGEAWGEIIAGRGAP